LVADVREEKDKQVEELKEEKMSVENSQNFFFEDEEEEEEEEWAHLGVSIERVEEKVLEVVDEAVKAIYVNVHKNDTLLRTEFLEMLKQMKAQAVDDLEELKYDIERKIREEK
jgi:hypothetical protein